MTNSLKFKIVKNIRLRSWEIIVDDAFIDLEGISHTFTIND